MTDRMKARFVGQVAIVTGGNSGIGLAAAQAFAREGARVVIAARRRTEGEAAVAGIKDAGGEAWFVETDVSRSDSVRAMVAQTVAHYGRLDVAFNNAGAPGQTNAEIQDADEDTFDQVMGLNVRGVWLCMKHQIPAMLKAGGGAIVNCSSLTGLRGGVRSGAYYASKHAVLGLTKVAALENATRNIRVNAVCPGLIATDMLADMRVHAPEKFQMLVGKVPVQRLGQADEVADAVLWLASSESSYVNGIALPVDGATSV